MINESFVVYHTIYVNVYFWGDNSFVEAFYLIKKIPRVTIFFFEVSTIILSLGWGISILKIENIAFTRKFCAVFSGLDLVILCLNFRKINIIQVSSKFLSIRYFSFKIMFLNFFFITDFFHQKNCSVLYA